MLTEAEKMELASYLRDLDEEQIAGETVSSGISYISVDLNDLLGQFAKENQISRNRATCYILWKFLSGRHREDLSSMTYIHEQRRSA